MFLFLYYLSLLFLNLLFLCSKWGILLISDIVSDISGSQGHEGLPLHLNLYRYSENPSCPVSACVRVLSNLVALMVGYAVITSGKIFVMAAVSPSTYRRFHSSSVASRICRTTLRYFRIWNISFKQIKECSWKCFLIQFQIYGYDLIFNNRIIFAMIIKYYSCSKYYVKLMTHKLYEIRQIIVCIYELHVPDMYDIV